MTIIYGNEGVDNFSIQSVSYDGFTLKSIDGLLYL